MSMLNVLCNKTNLMWSSDMPAGPCDFTSYDHGFKLCSCLQPLPTKLELFVEPALHTSLKLAPSHLNSQRHEDDDEQQRIDFLSAFHLIHKGQESPISPNKSSIDLGQKKLRPNNNNESAHCSQTSAAEEIISPWKHRNIVSILAPERFRHKVKLRTARKTLRDVEFSSPMGVIVRQKFKEQFSTRFDERVEEIAAAEKPLRSLTPLPKSDRKLRMPLISEVTHKPHLMRSNKGSGWEHCHKYCFTITELRRQVALNRRGGLNRESYKLLKLCQKKELCVKVKRLPITRNIKVLLHRVDCPCAANITNREIWKKYKGHIQYKNKAKDVENGRKVKLERPQQLRDMKRKKHNAEMKRLNSVKKVLAASKSNSNRKLDLTRKVIKGKTAVERLKSLKVEGKIKRVSTVPKRQIKPGSYKVPRHLLNAFISSLGSGVDYELVMI